MARAFFLFLALAATAHGTLIDVGAPGFTFTRAAGFAPLHGKQCNGQSLSVDLVFSNSVIVPQGVSRFEVGFELHTDTPFPGFILGTGFVLGVPVATGHFDSSDGSTGIAIFPFDFGSPFSKPFTLDSVHFDFTLPSGGAEILSGNVFLVALDNGKPFHIGTIPEGGSTFALLALGLVGCVVVRALRSNNAGHKVASASKNAYARRMAQTGEQSLKVHCNGFAIKMGSPSPQKRR